MGTRESYLEASRRAETIAAVSEPVVWISVITVLIAAVPYLLLLSLPGTELASGYQILSEMLVRVCLIGGLVGIVAAPTMALASWRAFTLQQLAVRVLERPVLRPVRSTGTYTPLGTAHKLERSLKGGAASWNF